MRITQAGKYASLINQSICPSINNSNQSFLAHNYTVSTTKQPTNQTLSQTICQLINQSNPSLCALFSRFSKSNMQDSDRDPTRMITMLSRTYGQISPCFLLIFSCRPLSVYLFEQCVCFFYSK